MAELPAAGAYVCKCGNTFTVSDVRAERAEAAISSVRALAEQWCAMDPYGEISFNDAADALLAALDSSGTAEEAPMIDPTDENDFRSTYEAAMDSLRVAGHLLETGDKPLTSENAATRNADAPSAQLPEERSDGAGAQSAIRSRSSGIVTGHLLYTDQDVELWGDPQRVARAILAALSSAGRLLPPGSETREEWGARLHRDDGFADDELRTGPRFLAESRVAFHRRKIEEVPGWRVRAAELISRRVITTPWSVPDTEPEG